MQASDQPPGGDQAHLLTDPPRVVGTGQREGIGRHRQYGEAAGDAVVSLDGPTKTFGEDRAVDQPGPEPVWPLEGTCPGIVGDSVGHRSCIDPTTALLEPATAGCTVPGVPATAGVAAQAMFDPYISSSGSLMSSSRSPSGPLK